MQKLITVLTAEEIIGHISYLLRTKYIDLLEKIENEIDEKSLDDIFLEYYENHNNMIYLHKLTPIEKDFLSIYDKKNYYIYTYNDNYCKNV